MTISLERLLKHMAWANQETIKHLQALPEESLKAYATNSEWFVAEILHHIVEAADNYAFRITGERPEVPGESIQEVKRWRSTILSQAIHHATEHRAQIASALEAKGFAPVDLDELDLWSYEIAKG